MQNNFGGPFAIRKGQFLQQLMPIHAIHFQQIPLFYLVLQGGRALGVMFDATDIMAFLESCWSQCVILWVSTPISACIQYEIEHILCSAQVSECVLLSSMLYFTLLSHSFLNSLSCWGSLLFKKSAVLVSASGEMAVPVPEFIFICIV